MGAEWNRGRDFALRAAHIRNTVTAHPTDFLAEFWAALADRYRIERELGRGGMASVHLAADLKHHRRVAIKVLHAELSAALGDERFLREIDVTAGLQHPNILPLFDSGSAAGMLYYVMPFVEGETLRHRMDREQQLSVDDATRIATDIAAALEYAHRRGVIHRDIKPENILIHDGRAVVADFGIAVGLDQAEARRITQTGISLGTPQYMSPEQAAGERSVDARSDIYSLGVVLYEMLAGTPPHTGPTHQAIVARLMTEMPTPLSTLRPGVPPTIEQAVTRALAKAPADRFSSAEDFARALSAPAVAPPNTRATSNRRRVLLSLVVVAAAATVAMFVWRRAPGAPTGTQLGRVTHLTRDPGLELDPALSPDGKAIAYAAGAAGNMRIFVRQMGGNDGTGGGQPIAIASAQDENQRWPQWSPDGTRIAFQVGHAERESDPDAPPNAIYVVASLGGVPRRLVADSAASDVSPAWSPDGKQIAFARGTGIYANALYVVDANGSGDAHKVADGRDVSAPKWSPDGSMLAYVSHNPRFSLGTMHLGNDAPSAILVVTLADHKAHQITAGTSLDVSPVWAPDSRSLLFVSNRAGSRDVYRIPITRSGEANGEPARMTTALNVHGIDLSRDGHTLAYSGYSPYSHIWSAPLPSPTSGPTSMAAATQITVGDETIEGIALSTNGQWLAYDSDRSGNGDVWKIPVTGGQPVQLTTHPSGDYVQDWSSDDAELAFHSYRTGAPQAYVMNADGGKVQQVTTTAGGSVNPEFSPDALAIAYDHSENASSRIYVTRRERRGAVWGPGRLLVNRNGRDPSWSPDGRSIAYIADGVRLVSPSGTDDRVLVSRTSDGIEPEFAYWSRDSKTLYYKAYDARGRSSIWAVAAAGGGKARLLIRFDDLAHPSARREFATDGKRLYFTIAQQESDIWLMELASR